MAIKHTSMMGVLLPDLHAPVFADIQDGVRDGPDGLGNQILITAGSTDISRQRETIRSPAELKVEGIVLAGYTGSLEDLAPGTARARVACSGSASIQNRWLGSNVTPTISPMVSRSLMNEGPEPC